MGRDSRDSNAGFTMFCVVVVFFQPYGLYCARVCPCYLLVPVLVDVILCSGDWVGFKGMRRFAMIFFFFNSRTSPYCN